MNKKEINDVQTDLLDWYDQNKKPLPWRKTKNPYNIWISEIMAQQTQVETVIPYYERFLTKYPTIEDLAAANDDELLKLWEGLGYYSRARNLKIAANEIVALGQFPSQIEEIKKLKGIGPYTAAAIGSIAFNLPEPAIDGNLFRVMGRFFEIDADISKSNARKEFDAFIRPIISDERPGDFNQALMDLGSRVCTPKIAKCEICPLANYCQAFKTSSQYNFPVKTKKIKVKDLYFAAIAIKNSLGEYYLVQRPAKGLLAKMWLFPLVETNKEQDIPTDFSQIPIEFSKLHEITDYTHVFSHQKWHIRIYTASPDEEFEVKEEVILENQAWVAQESHENYPFAGPQVKMFELLENENYSNNGQARV